MPAPYYEQPDPWLKEIAMSEDDDICYIGESYFRVNKDDKDYKSVVFAKYNLSAIFDLSNFIPTTGAKYCLYIFTKKQTEKILTAIYKKRNL